MGYVVETCVMAPTWILACAGMTNWRFNNIASWQYNQGMNKFRTGQAVEKWIGQELEKMGFEVLVYGFRSYFGEIDIVAVVHPPTPGVQNAPTPGVGSSGNSCLVFIEVKARTSTKFGQPYEAVNSRKLKKISKTGELFRSQWRKSKLPAATRIDVASVMLDRGGNVRSWDLMRNVTG